MVIDYLIVGQGISGSFLSYYLLKAGKKIMVIDKSNPFTASKVASGVINPVTGRRIVRTWRIEELLPFALDAYTKLEKEFEKDLVKQCSILDFHASLQMKEAFENRLTEEHKYLHKSFVSNWKSLFNFHFDIGVINSCLLVNINLLLTLFRARLQSQNNLIDEEFSWDDCVVNEDHVIYRNITASKIICCEGVAGVSNPFFRNLPYAPNKGEALIAKIPGLDNNFIYKQGLSIVPWKDDLFWIGSSYRWSYTDLLPTQDYKEKVSSQLKYWLKIPFEIVDHIAAARPANMERRPFAGLHPTSPAVGILNGLGTKGCSLAPFFANQLANYLTEEKPIYPDADVKRFTRILARRMN